MEEIFEPLGFCRATGFAVYLFTNSNLITVILSEFDNRQCQIMVNFCSLSSFIQQTKIDLKELRVFFIYSLSSLCFFLFYQKMKAANNEDMVLRSKCENSDTSLTKEHLLFSFVPSKLF